MALKRGKSWFSTPGELMDVSLIPMSPSYLFSSHRIWNAQIPTIVLYLEKTLTSARFWGDDPLAREGSIIARPRDGAGKHVDARPKRPGH